MVRQEQPAGRINRPFDGCVLKRRNETARIHRINDDAASRGRVRDVAQFGKRVAVTVLNKEPAREKEENLSSGKVFCRFDQALQTAEGVLVEASCLRL